MDGVVEVGVGEDDVGTLAGEVEGDRGEVLRTPGGKPASIASRPSSVTDAGVSSDGLMINVLPHAMAGAIFQVAIMSGSSTG